MIKKTPSALQLALATGFALSCFGLALFLWVAFGGPVPLKGEGYRVVVPFEEAAQLVVESDVRISGVTVGKVKEIELSGDGAAETTLELESRYAPLPADVRAILRAKTLLGETYVELTPGTDGTGTIPEGGTIAAAQVAESVQLDEVFRTFDEPTRRAFRAWMQSQAGALDRRGADVSAAIAYLDPFAERAGEALRVLDTQRLALRRFVRDTGEVFDALSARPGELSGLIGSAEAVFAQTAARNRELAETFRILPTFLRESRSTLDRLGSFAEATNPLITQLRPAARELSPTLIALERLAPELRGFFAGLDRAIAASARGLPALRDLLARDLRPLLARFEPFGAELNPLLEAVAPYRREIAAFLANAAAATNALNVPSSTGGRGVHYLRTTSPLGPGSLAAFSHRLSSERTNPYTAPGGYSRLAGGLRSFEVAQCQPGWPYEAILDPADAGAFPGDLFSRIRQFAFAGELTTQAVPAPPCVQQAPFRSIGGALTELTRYLHVRAEP